MFVSYESSLNRAQLALEQNRIFEAKRWVLQASTFKPGDPEVQRLVAKVISQEMAQEKLLKQEKAPEELSPSERALLVKTWLERSRGLLEIHEFKEALQAAEQVFIFEPENQEASRLIDEIQKKAQRKGNERNLLLESAYDKEIQTRIQHYTEQAEAWLRDQKWGAARFAIEKILFLNPQNPEGRRLLGRLEREEDPVETGKAL